MILVSGGDSSGDNSGGDGVKIATLLVVTELSFFRRDNNEQLRYRPRE